MIRLLVLTSQAEKLGAEREIGVHARLVGKSKDLSKVPPWETRFRTGILTRRSGVISGVLFWDTAYTDPSFPLCGSCCLLLFPSECPPHALDDAVCRQLHDIA